MPALLTTDTEPATVALFCDFHDHSHLIEIADVERLHYAQIAAVAVVQSGRDLGIIATGWPCQYWLLAQADQEETELAEYVRATVEARAGDGC